MKRMVAVDHEYNKCKSVYIHVYDFFTDPHNKIYKRSLRFNYTISWGKENGWILNISHAFKGCKQTIDLNLHHPLELKLKKS